MRWSNELRQSVGELFEGDGEVLDGLCGSAREYFESHALFRLVWNDIDRSFASRSRPFVDWDSSNSLVLSWRAETDGTVLQRVRVADLRFEDGLLSSFSVDGMPLPWVVRPFRSVDSDHVGWALVWRPGERLWFVVVDRVAHPIEKEFPGRVSGRVVDGRRVATVETVFGQLAPVDVMWYGQRGRWWLSSFDSPVAGLGPLSVQRFVVPDLDGGMHEFVPVGSQSELIDTRDVDVAHDLMLLDVSRVGDRRYVLPGSDSGCPWTLGRRFTFTAVDAGPEAIFEMRDLAASWRHRVMRDRGLEAQDLGIELRESESGFEVVFGGDEEKWASAHIAHLLSSMRFVLDAHAIDRVVVDASA